MLVVDDVMLVGKMVRQMLADERDVEEHYRRTAEAALEAAAPLRPTVILQDLVMPDVAWMAVAGLPVPRPRARRGT